MADSAFTTNTKQTDDLLLTGKPVLVQNNLGIFYGFLEKSDTRNGTALLRDSYILSPEHHITFSQYLDFFSAEIMDRVADLGVDIDDSIGEDDALTEKSYELMHESVVPNEILIDQEIFNEHKRNLTITDYASEGIFLVQYRTSTHEYSKHLQALAPLVSLTNVIAIVAISEMAILHTGLNEARKDLESSLLNGQIDSIEYYDSLTPMITFGLLNNDLQILICLALQEEGQDLDKIKLDKYIQEVLNVDTDGNLRVTRAFSHVLESIYRQVKLSEYIKEAKDIEFKDVAPLLQALADLPSLVVNSEKRVERYKEIKKAQSNEQAK